MRRNGIVEILRANGSVTVAEVEERYGVSSMTARRDLVELERQGIARRTHGGAVLPTITAHEDSFFSRIERSTAAKQALADAACELVTAEESVFLDSSSTAYHVARALVTRGEPVTLITNSQPIMELVVAHPTSPAELIGIGGTLRRLTRSFVGPVATAAVQAHFADHLFFSVKGLAPDGVLTDADALEAEVKRSMIQHAGEAVLLVDRSKLDSRGLSVIGPITSVGRMLAAGLTPADKRAFSGLGVRVDVVHHDDEIA